MNTQLQPPPVSPLDPNTRQRLRHQILNRATETRQTRRRWAPAVVAVTSVASVVAGIALIGTQLDKPASDPSVSAQPTEDIVPVDHGPITAADRAGARKCVQSSGGRELFGRRVLNGQRADGSPATTPVVLLHLKTNRLLACGISPGTPGFRPPVTPTKAKPVVQLDGGSASASHDSSGQSPVTMSGNWLAALPSVARIEGRIVWSGGHGSWYRAALVNGIAYLEASAMVPQGVHDQRIEYRAFDTAGKPVPVSTS